MLKGLEEKVWLPPVAPLVPRGETRRKVSSGSAIAHLPGIGKARPRVPCKLSPKPRLNQAQGRANSVAPKRGISCSLLGVAQDYLLFRCRVVRFVTQILNQH